MAEYDPDKIPVQPAATVMLIRNTPEMEVLMLKRNTRSVFVGDMWVFPGGGVDEADRDESLYPSIRGLNLDKASERLEVEDAPAYWIATIRETFEEAGVLVALDGAGRSIDPSVLTTAAIIEWRDKLNTGRASMAHLLEATGFTLDGSQFEYAARFVTPPGPPRRYDARFFVAHMPENQVASVDNDEAVGHVWISPSEAVAEHERGQMAMMTPTIACLQRLSKYGSADEAIDMARSGAINEQMRVDLGSDGAGRIVFPDDPRYDIADDRTEFGWMRI